MAATAVDKKLAEGIATEHLRLADKCLKTSLFKWKPDHDGAAAEYLKAATVFRNAKAFDQAKESYIKVGELLKAVNSPFQAAKAYEQAGLLCKENEEFDEAVHWMELAALMFQEHGTPDSAALCLEDAATMVEQEKPEKSIHLYTKASEMAEITSSDMIKDEPVNVNFDNPVVFISSLSYRAKLQDKDSAIANTPKKSAECIGKAARLQVKCFKFEDAIKSLCQEIKYWLAAENYVYINKVSMGVILLYLTGEDYVAADKFFRGCLNYPEFGTSEEAGALEDLLRAYDDGDEETGQAILARPVFKSLDNVFAKLAGDLKFPSGISTPKPEAATDNENLPAATDSENLPAATDSENLPAATDSENLPAATDSENLPAATDSENLPAAIDTENLPAAIDSENLPAATDSENLPADEVGVVKEIAPVRSNIVEEDELPPELY